MCRALSLLCALALLVAAAPARGEERDPAQARSLFESGKADAKAEDYRAAVAKFSKSYRLDPKPGTLRNVAFCEEQLGRLASALRHYRELAEKFPKATEHAKFASERAAELEKRVPRLTIKFAEGAPPGTKIVLDGNDVAASDVGKPLPVNPGEHDIEFEAPSCTSAKYDVTLAEREERAQTVHCAPVSDTNERNGEHAQAPLPQPNSSQSTAESLGTGRTVALVIAGVGLAAGVGAGAAYLSALGAKDSADTAASEGRAAEMAEYRSEQQSRHSVSIALGVVAAAAVGSAAVIWIVAKPSHTSAAQARFGLVARGNRIALEGRW